MQLPLVGLTEKTVPGQLSDFEIRDECYMDCMYYFGSFAYKPKYCGCIVRSNNTSSVEQITPGELCLYPEKKLNSLERDVCMDKRRSGFGYPSSCSPLLEEL